MKVQPVLRLAIESEDNTVSSVQVRPETALRGDAPTLEIKGSSCPQFLNKILGFFDQ